MNKYASFVSVNVPCTSGSQEARDEETGNSGAVEDETVADLFGQEEEVQDEEEGENLFGDDMERSASVLLFSKNSSLCG